jgi:lipopolysaccharide exporter
MDGSETGAAYQSARKKSSFVGDVLTLMIGTTFAQVLGILVTPILTRLYGPEAFGLLAIFTAITGIVGIIACMRYEFSIVLPESDSEGANLLGLSLIITGLVSLSTIPVFWFGQGYIIQWLNAPLLGNYLWLVTIAVFVGGAFAALNYWNSRTKQFRRLSAARVTQSFATAGTQVGAGASGFATGGSLIGAYVIGHSVSTAILGGQIWRDDSRLLRQSIHWRGMLSGLKRYRRFPLYDTSSAMMNSISWQLPVFLLSAFFSPIIVGFYALGFRILQLPMFFIGGSLAQVFFRQAAEAKQAGTLGVLVENISHILVSLGIFPILAITIIGRDLFMVVFGSVWAEAGVYSQILSIWAFVWFISSPISTLYIVLERQDFGLRMNALNFVTRFIALGIGGLLGNVLLAIALFAVSGIFVYSYLCLKLMILSGVELAHIRQNLLSRFALFLPAGVLLVVLKLLNVDPLLLVGVAAVSGVVYYLYLVKTDPRIKKMIRGNSILKRLPL